MIVERLAIAGTRIDLEVEGRAADVRRRLGAFTGAPGPARWTLGVRAGPLAIGRLTGRVSRRDGRLQVVGAESMGSLDLASRRGDAVADESLVAVEGLVRAAVTLDVLERGGCLFHAAAVVVDGRSHLVPGRSGSGKSSFAALAAAPLADELCAVVPEDGALAVHGTPWWAGRPASAPLAGVHVLAWDGEGTCPLPRREALRHLVGNVTLVVDDPETRARAFAAAARVAAEAPFGRLAFTLRSNVDAILRGARAAA